MSLIHKFDPIESVPANSDAAESLLSLASSIEAQLTKCTEKLLDGGYHMAAHQTLETMMHCVSSLRALVAGQDLVNVTKRDD